MTVESRDKDALASSGFVSHRAELADEGKMTSSSCGELVN
jgi:hypothetical protein